MLLTGLPVAWSVNSGMADIVRCKFQYGWHCQISSLNCSDSQLWGSGFSISHSKAAGVVNGDKVNRTIYYVLSNVPAPMHDLTTSRKERLAIEKVLYYPDRCYEDHYTLWVRKTLWKFLQYIGYWAEVVCGNSTAVKQWLVGWGSV